MLVAAGPVQVHFYSQWGHEPRFIEAWQRTYQRMQFGGPREVAPVLGISEATVKTHLQHIYAKTDTSRQADLVKLVAGHMSPLSDSQLSGARA